jgi:hypothetical protein
MTAPAERTSKQRYGKRGGSTPKYDGPHVRLFPGKLLVKVGARLIMLLIPGVFLLGLSLAMSGKGIKNWKDLKTADFANQAKAAFEQVGSAFGGR